MAAIDGLEYALATQIPVALGAKATEQVQVSNMLFDFEDFTQFSEQVTPLKPSLDKVYLASIYLNSNLSRQYFYDESIFEINSSEVTNEIRKKQEDMRLGEIQSLGQAFIKAIERKGQCLIGTFIDRSTHKAKGWRGTDSRGQPAEEKARSHLGQKMSKALSLNIADRSLKEKFEQF